MRRASCCSRCRSPGQRPDVHLAQVKAVADRDRVAIGHQVGINVLAHHPDDVVAVDRDVRVGDLIIDDVIDTRGLGAQALVHVRGVDAQIVIEPVLQPIFAEQPDPLIGLDVSATVASELLLIAQ